MTDDPNSDNFNWVNARLEAIPVNAFALIRRDIEDAVNARNASLEKTNALLHVELGEGNANSDRLLRVLVQPKKEDVYGQSTWIDFYLHDDGCVHVEGHGISDTLKFTPVLDSDGVCRFKSGDNPTPTLLRWQVIRMGLEALLFERN